MYQYNNVECKQRFGHQLSTYGPETGTGAAARAMLLLLFVGKMLPRARGIDFSYPLHKVSFLKVFVIEAKRIMHWTLNGSGRYCATLG